MTDTNTESLTALELDLVWAALREYKRKCERVGGAELDEAKLADDLSRKVRAMLIRLTLFAITKVTTGQVIWAGIALDKTWASKLAAEALRTKPGASWHVCPAADLPDGGKEALAVAKGFEDGTAAVDAVLNEQGKAAVIKANKPGQDWDWAARNADAASFAGIAKGSKEAYYRAYASAGRLRAEAIEDGEACPDGDNRIRMVRAMRDAVSK